jgi:hypothetical protein
VTPRSWISWSVDEFRHDLRPVDQRQPVPRLSSVLAPVREDAALFTENTMSGEDFAAGTAPAAFKEGIDAAA